MNPRWRVTIFGIYILLAGWSLWLIPSLRFSFDFEQFFPQGDPDLEFFNEFRKAFRADDSFLLIAFERKQGVFDSTFLAGVHRFTLDAAHLPYVTRSTSLTNWVNPVRVIFGPEAFITVPAIRIDQPDRYHRDSIAIMADERFVGQLIDRDATVLVVALQTEDDMFFEESETLMAELRNLLKASSPDNYYILGRAYFQDTMVKLQIREIVFSTVVAVILVTLILIVILRTYRGVLISLVSIGTGMLLFLAYMALLGMELSLMSALYPILMIIVGTSDVVHIMSKYTHELRAGRSKAMAVDITLREIGLATLMTSVTTAIGFLSLVTSRIQPIKEFGLNAAAGVMIAYITVITLTVAMMSAYDDGQLEKNGRLARFWRRITTAIYLTTQKFPGRIAGVAVVLLMLAGWGISKVSTNYRIESNLPLGAEITRDFQFFEQKLAGFRPYELAITARSPHTITDFALMSEINAIEEILKDEELINQVVSPAVAYKSAHRAWHGDRIEYYHFPADSAVYSRYKQALRRIVQGESVASGLISNDGTMARISARVKDAGADSIQDLTHRISVRIVNERDTSLFDFRLTGTGVIVDKNSQYVRDSLFYGLGTAVLVVSFLMFLLFRSWPMVLISLVPNIVPLFFAAAMIGFMGIELEAGVAIVFAIIFGIAVDDSIHFLAKFRLVSARGHSVNRALLITTRETGKAIILTSIILFAGFLILLFSSSPPNVTVGLLISLTLVTAVICDLYLLPVLIRRFMPEYAHGRVSGFLHSLSPGSYARIEQQETPDR